MFKAPFSFNGRIRRLEYGLTFIIFYGYIFIGLIMIQLIPRTAQSNYKIIQLVFLLMILPGYWFLFAQGAKRCHDRGNSGWYQLIPFYALWMLFAEGFPGQNEYGINPKGVGNYDEINEIGKHLER